MNTQPNLDELDHYRRAMIGSIANATTPLLKTWLAGTDESDPAFEWIDDEISIREACTDDNRIAQGLGRA